MANFPIYVGLWTNWSQGKILGATLTLKQTEANLLIAFAAFWVAIVTDHLWSIACFAIHSSYSSQKPQNGLYHQRQAVLRNNAGPASSALKLLLVVFAWRNAAGTSTRRILPLLAYAVMMTVAFTIAAGFSSRIVTINEVLLSSPACGFVDWNKVNSSDELHLYAEPHMSRTISASANYARQCYSANNSYTALDCNTYIRSSLPFEAYHDAPCPFSDKRICYDNESNLILDSGLIDSHNDLGLNTPPEHRFLYRLRVHCAPIRTEGYTSVFNHTSERSYTRYNYGIRDPSTTFAKNYTYEYSNDMVADARLEDFTSGQEDYSIGRVMALWSNDTLQEDSQFEPIEELRRTDGNLYLFFLSANGIVFATNTTDRWYRATRPEGHLNTTFYGDSTVFKQTFRPDQPASPLACLDQDQFCNPNRPEGDQCTPLASDFDTGDLAKGLFQDPASSQMMAWAWNIYQDTISIDGVSTLGSTSLTSRDNLLSGVQGPLPENQWKLDVQHWFSTSLAMLQKTFVDAATGPSDPVMMQFQTGPSNAMEQTLCNSQKILSNEYTSFNVFGISLLFGIGVIIIAISLSLERLVGFIRDRLGSSSYSLLEWTMNETLQLQRFAHEALGLGTWRYGFTRVPTTEDAVELGVLDISDPKLPKLTVPKAEKEDESGENDIENPGANSMLGPALARSVGDEMTTETAPNLDPAETVADDIGRRDG